MGAKGSIDSTAGQETQRLRYFCIITLIYFEMNPADEQQLVESAANDPEAFGMLYERHYQPIFGYIFRRTLDWESAEDITSDVFIKAYKNIWRFRWSGVPISAWFYRIASNEVKMYFRRGKKASVSLNELMESRGFDVTDPQTPESERKRIEQELDQHKDFAAIQSQVEQLPVKYQEVIALRYFEQKSITEIAEILDKNENTVKSLLARGLERIRQKI